jgi:hypothetical protein
MYLIYWDTINDRMRGINYHGGYSPPGDLFDADIVIVIFQGL